MKPAVLIAGLTAVAIWGASPAATKVAVAEMSPYDVALLRTAISGVIALPLVLLMRSPLPATRRQAILLAVSATAGFIAFPLVFSVGQQMTSATHGALLLALVPVITGLYARAWDRTWPRPVWIAGCLVALVGAAILVLSPAIAAAPTGRESTIAGDLVIFAATLCAALGYVAGGKLAQSGYPSSAATFWGAGLAGAAMLAVAVVIGAPARFQLAGPSAQAGVVYLALGVTILAYVLWYWALARGGIERVATLQFLQPVTGVISAALLLAELPGWSALVATVVIVAGVMLATGRANI